MNSDKVDVLCDVVRIAYYAYNSCNTTDSTGEQFFEDCQSGLQDWKCNCLTVKTYKTFCKLLCKTPYLNIDTTCAFNDKLVSCTAQTGVKVKKIAYYELYGKNAISELLNIINYNFKCSTQKTLGLICLVHCYIGIYRALRNTTNNMKQFYTMCYCLQAMFSPNKEQNALTQCITDIRKNHAFSNMFMYNSSICNVYTDTYTTEIIKETWECMQRAITYLTQHSIDDINKSAYTWFDALYDLFHCRI